MVPSNDTASKRRQSPRPLLVAGLIVGIFLASHIIRNRIHDDKKAQQLARHATHYQHVVALSPSIVEIIYLLGMEDRLVGVSRYANYPPEATLKPSVGGYIDLNYEKLLALDPDCVILLTEQASLAKKLASMDIQTVTVDHNHTRGILDSIQTIGNELGYADRAGQVVSRIEHRIENLRSNYGQPTTRPRVMVCISRDTTADQAENVIIAGNAGFHRELIHMAGGTNAYQGPVAFPSVSREKLIELNPDVIIDLVNTDTWNQTGRLQLLSQWNKFSELKAVRDGRVIIIHGDQHLIPGPRFHQTLEQFALAIHR